MDYNKTLKGKIVTLYHSQISHSKKRGHTAPEYSKQEFIDRCLMSEKFNTLFEEWVESGFEKDLAPSIDRIKDELPYTFGNILVCTWKENNEKGYIQRKSGINNLKNKSVNQICLKTGKVLNTFYSILEAENITGCYSKHICAVCKGKRNTTGGFKWEYNE